MKHSTSYSNLAREFNFKKDFFKKKSENKGTVILMWLLWEGICTELRSGSGCRENLVWWLGPQCGALNRWWLPSRQQTLSESYFPSLHGVCLVDQTKTASSLLYLYTKNAQELIFPSFLTFVYILCLWTHTNWVSPPYVYAYEHTHTCVCSHMHSNIHKINIHMQLFFFVFAIVLWVFFNVECDVIWYVFPFNWN